MAKKTLKPLEWQKYLETPKISLKPLNSQKRLETSKMIKIPQNYENDYNTPKTLNDEGKKIPKTSNWPKIPFETSKMTKNILKPSIWPKYL